MSYHAYEPTANDDREEQQVEAELELDWYPPAESAFWDPAAADGPARQHHSGVADQDARDRASYYSAESAATAVDSELAQYYRGKGDDEKDK
jgi:hypothetical protein